MNHAKPNRWYCFTINHPTADDDQQLIDIARNCTYLVYGKEHFETEGLTPHYQGYLELPKPQRFSWIKKRLSRAHLEPRKGSRDQARDYCFKECSNPREFGVWQPDQQGARNDLVAIKSKIETGSSELDIASGHFSSWCRNHRAFNRYRELVRPARRTWKTEVHVRWGDAGTGKTRSVYDESPDVHDMHYANQFWSDYHGEEEVLIDDFDSSMMTRQTFLKLTDRYPFKLRVLGAFAEWVPRKIYITSNFNPKYWYGGDPAVLRRLTTIKEFVTVSG